MKGSELVSLIRDHLGDDSYDSADIMRAGTWFVNELAAKNRLRIFEESDTLSGAAGDTTVDFPDDMLTMIELYLTVPQVYDLKNTYKEYGDFMRDHPNFATATQAQAWYWTDFSNALRFAAPLNAAHTFAIDYIRIPTQVTKTTQSYELPRIYDETLFKGALVRVMEQDEDYEVSAQERQLLTELKTTLIKNEGRGQIKTGPVIMRTNRRIRRDY